MESGREGSLTHGKLLLPGDELETVRTTKTLNRTEQVWGPRPRTHPTARQKQVFAPGKP